VRNATHKHGIWSRRAEEARAQIRPRCALFQGRAAPRGPPRRQRRGRYDPGEDAGPAYPMRSPSQRDGHAGPLTPPSRTSAGGIGPDGRPLAAPLGELSLRKMPTDLRQPARESYEGIALRGAFWIRHPGGRGRGGRDTALTAGASTGSGDAAWRVADVCEDAVVSPAWSSTDRGLMATEAGGLRTTGGPLGKRSGCSA
jgi:hypothetical protein